MKSVSSLDRVSSSLILIVFSSNPHPISRRSHPLVAAFTLSLAHRLSVSLRRGFHLSLAGISVSSLPLRRDGNLSPSNCLHVDFCGDF